MFSFYHLIKYGILDIESYTISSTFPPKIVYKNKNLNSIVFNSEIFNESDENMYLMTNSPKVYLENRNSNSRLRFIAYWSNFHHWSPKFINSTDISLDPQFCLSISTKRLLKSYDFSLVTPLNDLFDNVYIDVSHFNLKQSFKYIWSSYYEYVKVFDSGVTVVGFENYFIPDICDNNWTMFMGLSRYQPGSTKLWYYEDKQSFTSQLLNFIFNLYKIDNSQKQITNGITNIAIQLDNIQEKALQLYKFSVDNLVNISIDPFERCNTENDIISVLQ